MKHKKKGYAKYIYIWAHEGPWKKERASPVSIEKNIEREILSNKGAT